MTDTGTVAVSGIATDGELSTADKVATALAAVFAVAVIATIVWLAIIGVLAGLFTAPDWGIKVPRYAVDTEASPRAEVGVESWVGAGEDRYGVVDGGLQTLRLARHCDGAWSITYPSPTAVLPPAGAPVQAHVVSPAGEVTAAGRVAANNTTAMFPAAPAFDEALIVNGDVRITVTDGERRLSLSETTLTSRNPRLWPLNWANPVSYNARGAFNPVELLDDACP